MSGPLGTDRLRSIADAALEHGGDTSEVLVLHEWGGLTRFAASTIHQSTAREETGVRVRVVDGGRVGVATTNDLSEEGAAAAARDAAEIARVAAPDPHFPGLAPAVPLAGSNGPDHATGSTSPAERAETVAEIVGHAAGGFRAAGAYETMAMEVAVANSNGHYVDATTSRANANVVISGGDGGAGYAESTAGSKSDLDPGAVGGTAARKARDSQAPRDLPAGRYDVVLEPAAVSALVGFLAYLGFGGRSIAEGRSCLSGREGEQVMAPSVSIWDDATAPDTLGLPFDFEGTPKRRVELVKDGIFLGGVHDRRSAALTGTASTGHALPPPNPEGAFPLNLFLGTGDASVEDMVRSVERGLLVTRFHYTNIVNPKDAVITGMTRDGTWLIEGGEIAHPVKNLRFTQSILDALRGVEMIGADSTLASEFFFDASRVPALKIPSFGFSGVSDH